MLLILLLLIPLIGVFLISTSTNNNNFENQEGRSSALALKQTKVIALNTSPATLAYIRRLKFLVRKPFLTRECDYSKILALSLVRYFRANANWCVVPEWVLSENHKPDYLISKIETNILLPSYGSSYNHLVVEVKNRVAVSWWVLLGDQAWDQCDLAKDSQSGRIYFIGQIGFEICFFFFDVQRFPSRSDFYTNFSPVNLRNFSKEDLDHLEIGYLTEVNNGNNEIRVIKWRWDDETHHIYIHEMFDHILNNTV